MIAKISRFTSKFRSKYTVITLFLRHRIYSVNIANILIIFKIYLQITLKIHCNYTVFTVAWLYWINSVFTASTERNFWSSVNAHLRCRISSKFGVITPKIRHSHVVFTVYFDRKIYGSSTLNLQCQNAVKMP